MSDDFLFDMETLFLALADKTRLRLLNLMRQDEVCVCFFTEVLKDSQPKISRHLAYLRNARIVEARRQGKWMNYRIIKPENEYARRVLENTLEWLRSQKAMREDYEKLLTAYGAAGDRATIARAPKPNILQKTDMNINRKEQLETFLL